MIGIPTWIEGHCIIKAGVESYIKVQPSKNHSISDGSTCKVNNLHKPTRDKKIVESLPDLLAARK